MVDFDTQFALFENFMLINGLIYLYLTKEYDLK